MVISQKKVRTLYLEHTALTKFRLFKKTNDLVQFYETLLPKKSCTLVCSFDAFKYRAVVYALLLGVLKYDHVDMLTRLKDYHLDKNEILK